MWKLRERDGKLGIMQATESALRAQHEQEASIVTEMTGYRRALKEVQAHNEQVRVETRPKWSHSL